MSLYSSHDTEPMDIRESKEYIASSDKEQHYVIKEQNKMDKRANKMPLRQKIKTGKKAICHELVEWIGMQSRHR